MIVSAVLIGVVVGVVVGSLGAGGGILSVPVLVYVLGRDPHQATGLSLIIVGMTAAVSLGAGDELAGAAACLFLVVGGTDCSQPRFIDEETEAGN